MMIKNKTIRKYKQEKHQYAYRIISLLKNRKLNHVFQLQDYQITQFQQGLKILIEKSSSSSKNFQIYKAMLQHVHLNLQASKNQTFKQTHRNNKDNDKSLDQKTSDSFSNTEYQINQHIFSNFQNKEQYGNTNDKISQKTYVQTVSQNKSFQNKSISNLSNLLKPIQSIFKKDFFTLSFQSLAQKNHKQMTQKQNLKIKETFLIDLNFSVQEQEYQIQQSQKQIKFSCIDLKIVSSSCIKYKSE